MVKKIIQNPRREGKTSIVNRALRHIGVDMANRIDQDILIHLGNTQEQPTVMSVPSILDQYYQQHQARAIARQEREIFHRYCLNQINTRTEELRDGACEVYFSLFDYHHTRMHLTAEMRRVATYVRDLHEESQIRLTNHAYDHQPTRERVIIMIQRDEEFRHTYGRSPAAQMMEDMAMYGHGFMWLDEDAKAKPEKEERYKCIFAQEEIKSACGRFTAELMRTNFRLWEESDSMRNCLYRSYREKIKVGKYLAYHVSAPHLGFRTGFTFGYDSDGPKKILFENRGKLGKEYKIRQEWRCDQIRGKANSRCDDRDLQAFGDEIARRLTDSYTRYETHEQMTW